MATGAPAPGPGGPGAPGAATTCFVLREGYAMYRGPVVDGSPHAHAAFQIAVAPRGEMTVEDASGRPHRAAALLVPPMVRHRLRASPELLVFYIEPHCAFADRLRALRAPGITAAPEQASLCEEEVRAATARPSRELDGRLLAVMGTLARERVPIGSLAPAVGLSPQRLRALARAQLGMPLPRWRIWQALARAARALAEGRSPAEAALDGGFADQAHFTRQLREMTGLTPSQVAPLLRRSAAPGHVDGDGPGDR
ncbi:AraC family transcriptional regulator [Streptomyces sp. NPDC057939]|uniref:AraC family transcriptional regulator n=1 Tax=Streptomyces sp. NPDC057939 TaxID=3346284 RepID=UPI0036E8401C